MSNRILILTNGNYFAGIILSRLFRKYNASIVGVVIVTGDYKARSGLQAFLHIGMKTTVPYLFYKVLTIVAFSIADRLIKNKVFTVEGLCKKYGLPIYKTVSVNSEDTLLWATSKKPNFIVSVSCPQLIRKKMLSIATIANVNIHSSLLPSYAGLAPYYWVLSKGEKKTGTTVHIITSKFDEGNILVQQKVDIEPHESAYHLFKRLASLGSVILVKAVDLSLKGFVGEKQDLSRSTYYSNPDFPSYIQLKKNGHCLIRFRELISTMQDESLYLEMDKTVVETLA